MSENMSPQTSKDSSEWLKLTLGTAVGKTREVVKPSEPGGGGGYSCVLHLHFLHIMLLNGDSVSKTQKLDST